MTSFLELREAPDIDLVGEMRDLETVSMALETDNTGHLVFGTPHTATAGSTVDRIVYLFPPEQQNAVRATLVNAKAVECEEALSKAADKPVLARRFNRTVNDG